MDEILKDLNFCFTCLDDNLVCSCSPQEYDQHLRTLFTQLQTYGILMNPSKCVFCVPEIFLGYKISSLCSQPFPERVADFQAYPPPKTAGLLGRFLRMLNFYRRFLPSTQLPFKPLFAIKTLLLILQHFKHCPLQSSPIYWRYTFLPLFECFLERTFCDGAQVCYRIFLNLVYGFDTTSFQSGFKFGK